MSMVTTRRRSSVPVKTILASVGSVLATAIVIVLLNRLQKVVVWVGVAAFFALVLHPAVTFLVGRARMRRSLAAIVMFLVATGSAGGLGFLFVRPLVGQVNIAVNEFPGYVADAKAGRGTIGHVVKKYNLDGYVQRNQAGLKDALKAAEKPAIHVAKGLLSTLTAAATVIVVTFLLLIEGPRMLAGVLAVLSDQARERTTIVIGDVSRALAGYMGGIVARSVLAATFTYVALWALGVPFRGGLALWVGFTALIPLVGVVIGMIPAAAVAFIHSTSAGVAVVVILLAYHLVENRTVTKRINERTIALSPLAVAVSVLVGFSLLGILGALLAIPGAGVLHVVLRDVWGFRQPTIADQARSGEGE